MVAIGGIGAVSWCAATTMPAVAAPVSQRPAAQRAAVQRPALAPAGVIRSAARQSAPVVRDVGPARGTKQGLAAPDMSVSMLAADAARQFRARQMLRMLQQNVTADTKCTSRACRHGLPATRLLRATQEPQIRGYFCGPATVSEMLAQLGEHVTQTAAARELQTDPSGTNWSDGSGYPVPDVLNRNQKKNDYVAVALPWSPTTGQVHTFETDLVADANHHGGVPLAGNAYEVAGGPHLVGNPVNQTIFHWFDIRGYQDYGRVTDYEDSVHGASSIGWSVAVPAYSSLASSAVVSILGARGYDW